MLGIFSTYKKNRLFKLPGVNSDRNKLYQIVSTHKIPFEFIVDEKLSLDNAVKALLDYKYNILWFCGHGIKSADGKSSYVLPSTSSVWWALFPQFNLFSWKNLHFCLAGHPASVLICVFDFCHSSEMLPLGYTYFSGKYEADTTKTNVFGYDKVRISIAGANVKETAPENIYGGFLTQYLTFLLDKYGYLSLWLIDGERASSTNSFVLKTNQIIDDRKPFLQLYSN